MSYSLLTSLYYGEGSNADLTSGETRALLHVPTALEQLVPAFVDRGLDVVLTGNPGDGKSHLVRTLIEAKRLAKASVVLDLSAQPTAEVVESWKASRRARRPFVLCANEGPLLDLLTQLSSVTTLSASAAELRRQLGALTVRRPEALPPEPRTAVLIDLAERSVLDPGLIERALARVCSERFLPELGHLSLECSAGRNLLLLIKWEATRQRLAQVLSLAGRRSAQHITFRQLWACIAYGLTAGKSPARLKAEVSRDEAGLGTYPLDNLVRPGTRGLLPGAVRAFGDPAAVTDPELDEQIWTTGQPSSGLWLLEHPPHESPALLWARGDRQEALELHARLKRLVALSHERGEVLIHGLSHQVELPSSVESSRLREVLVAGLRSLYLSPAEAGQAPRWLREGLPLWLGFSYQEVPPEQRPHVAVSAMSIHEFEVLRPQRPRWLERELGPLPEVVWLEHRESGISLQVDPELLTTLVLASQRSGPMELPEPVQRFIWRLSGWEESRGGTRLEGDEVAVLTQPRGPLEVTAAVRTWQRGGTGYA